MYLHSFTHIWSKHMIKYFILTALYVSLIKFYVFQICLGSGKCSSYEDNNHKGVHMEPFIVNKVSNTDPT